MNVKLINEREASVEYYIRVKSTKINNKTVKFNSTVLKINKRGLGGTKISTVNIYTVLGTSIYNEVTEAFGACFSSKNIGRTHVGPGVPKCRPRDEGEMCALEKVWCKLYGKD